MTEIQLTALLCAFLGGGEAETRQYFDVYGMARHVRVDCETPSHVIELGLDGTPSARDSVHQALFAAHLTGKMPVVLMIDRDGYEGRFEYELRHTAPMAGVLYLRCTEAVIVRWAATAPGRGRAQDDLPATGNARTVCDLSALTSSAGVEAF